MSLIINCFRYEEEYIVIISSEYQATQMHLYLKDRKKLKNG